MALSRLQSPNRVCRLRHFTYRQSSIESFTMFPRAFGRTPNARREKARTISTCMLSPSWNVQALRERGWFSACPDDQQDENGAWGQITASDKERNLRSKAPESGVDGMQVLVNVHVFSLHLE